MYKETMTASCLSWSWCKFCNTHPKQKEDFELGEEEDTSDYYRGGGSRNSATKDKDGTKKPDSLSCWKKFNKIASFSPNTTNHSDNNNHHHKRSIGSRGGGGGGGFRDRDTTHQQPTANKTTVHLFDFNAKSRQTNNEFRERRLNYYKGLNNNRKSNFGSYRGGGGGTSTSILGGAMKKGAWGTL